MSFGNDQIALRERVELLEAELRNLRQEVADLRKLIAAREKEQMGTAALTEFVEHRGALFKRKPGGGFHQAVYCPKCEGPMSSLAGEIPYLCQPCRVAVDFTGRELTTVMSELQ